MGDQSNDAVRRLDDLGRTDAAVAGGKAANLGTLAGAGLPVPSGVVVTTEAYRSLVGSGPIRDAIDRLDALGPEPTDAHATLAAALRSRIADRSFDPATASAIREAVAAIDGGDGFAVRSSATAEDLPSASFAGQHETFLGVDQADVLDRVRDCLGSLFTDRAVAYRTRNGIGHADAEMAVLVQPMVDATAAGVLFTADPATGNRHVAAVDANFGLGESVVAGDVTPDHALVDSHTGEVLEYTVGSKAVAVELGGSGAAGAGTTRVDLPLERRETRVLTDDQLRTLVGFGERAESLLGAPQDVEWALAGGRFVLLQSRPITSLFPPPSPTPDDGRLHAYVSMGHMQAMPEAMPPLVRDVWHAYTRTALAEMGLGTGLEELTVEAGGRVYIDVTPFLRRPRLRSWLVDGLAAVNERVADGLTELLARRPEAFESRGVTVGSLPRYAVAGGRVARLVAPALPRIAWTVLATLGGRAPDPEDEAWTGLGDLFAGPVGDGTVESRARAVFEGLDITGIVRDAYPRISPLFLAFAIGGWLGRRFPDRPTDVNAVGRGFERDVVTRINLGLGDLADVARAHPPIAEALRDGASLAALESVEGGDAFREAFESFLAEFGHRGAGEIDLSRPRWREDPSMLLAVVRANLADADAGDHHDRIRRLADDAEAAAERLETEADRGVLGPLRRWYVRRLIDTYRETVYLREYPKQEAARAFTAWREALLDAGDRLVEAGRIDEPADVWFLRKDELFAGLDGEPVGADIDARRREHVRDAERDAPPVLTSEGEAIRGVGAAGDAPEGALVGTGVSTGVVEGVARVVRDPGDATVEAGEILVARSTDPGWTPLFLNAAGLVSEVGGPVSHGALVAREYGLPAVVSVPEATTRIESGQRIRIDGTRGTVELLDVAGESPP